MYFYKGTDTFFPTKVTYDVRVLLTETQPDFYYDPLFFLLFSFLANILFSIVILHVYHHHPTRGTNKWVFDISTLIHPAHCFQPHYTSISWLNYSKWIITSYHIKSSLLYKALKDFHNLAPPYLSSHTYHYAQHSICCCCC